MPTLDCTLPDITAVTKLVKGKGKAEPTLVVPGLDALHLLNGYDAVGDFFAQQVSKRAPVTNGHATSPLASTSSLPVSDYWPIESNEPLVQRLLQPLAPYFDTQTLPSDALQRYVNAELSEAESDLWTVTCAPQSAAEVLGKANKGNAILLRDWLQELKLRKWSGKDGADFQNACSRYRSNASPSQIQTVDRAKK